MIFDEEIKDLNYIASEWYRLLWAKNCLAEFIQGTCQQTVDLTVRTNSVLLTCWLVFVWNSLSKGFLKIVMGNIYSKTWTSHFDLHGHIIYLYYLEPTDVWIDAFIYIWKSDLKSMIDLTEHRTKNLFQIIDPQLEVLWTKFTKWYPCLCIHLDIQATKMNTNTCLTLTFIMNVGHNDLIKIAGRKADHPAHLCNL